MCNVLIKLKVQLSLSLLLVSSNAGGVRCPCMVFRGGSEYMLAEHPSSLEFLGILRVGVTQQDLGKILGAGAGARTEPGSPCAAV